MQVASHRHRASQPCWNTWFTEMPGVIAEAPAQSASPVATAQSGQAVEVYVSRSMQVTWLFQQIHNRGANS